MFGLAAGVRLYPWAPPTFIAERQYRSALLARSFYFDAELGIPDWRREVVRAAVARKDAMEPPLFEFVVSRIYLMINGERLWISRLLSATFWLIGGVFFLRLSKRFASTLVALVLTAYYLLVPLGVHVSASFLPDPLMIMLFIVSLLAIVRYYEERSGARLLLAALLAGIAILVKPLCLFAILGAFLGLAVYEWQTKGGPIIGHVVAFLTISLLVGTTYYLNGMVLDDYMTAQANKTFAPPGVVVRHVEYWVGWLLNAGWAVGYLPLAAGLLGLVVQRERRMRAMLLGLWGGYLVFLLVFAFHVHITPHYHLQLVPIVALSAAPLVFAVTDRLRPALASWPGGAIVTLAGLLAIAFGVYEVRESFVSAPPFERTEVAEEIGEIVEHSTRVAFVSFYYGSPLEYFGEMAGEEWPRPLRYWAFREKGEGERDIAQRVHELGISPRYFVVTDFAEFEKHHRDLRDFLASACTLVAKTERYLVYETENCVRQLLSGPRGA